MIEYTALLIEQILQHVTVKEIMENQMGDYIPLSRLKSICFVNEDFITETDLEKRLEYMVQWIQEECHNYTYEGRNRNRVSFFDLVDCFSKNVLTKTGREIVYRYKFLNEWHRSSTRVGEDLFVTCAFAFQDFYFGENRKDFSWKWVLGHDNYELNRVLNKGLSDNHYHLMGSLPYFDLSWSSLMNSVVDEDNLRMLDKLDDNPRNIRKTYIKTKSEEPYRIMHLKAALIRLYLYSELSDCILLLGDYKANVYWLLENIFEIECPENFLDNNNGLIWNLSDINIKGYLERISSNVFQIEEECPGFYFFFWKRCPDLPIDLLSDRSGIFNAENLQAICEYVERNYMPFSLAECSWIFKGKYYKVYREEWKRQTWQIFEQWMADDMQILTARYSIQRAIDMLHERMEADYKDYMMREIHLNNSAKQERFVLYGERWFLYEMFYHRYEVLETDYCKSEKIFQYYLIYLVIKNRFRRELNSSNGKMGFANFSVFQKRKTWFTTSFSNLELVRYAVGEAFYRERLNSLELRITPGKSWQENCRMIYLCENAIRDLEQPPNLKQFYYVFHFRKRKDLNKGLKNAFPSCRHERFRMELKRDTNAILLMRRHNSELAGRVRGVDACSSEDGCRPEVFAVAFRVLKNEVMPYHQDGKNLSQLRLSYHVGEDNQDVLDGIRAIDEAVYFLGMGSGDRLGHATMLGVDPWEWYYRRHYKISIRQQDYLDNVVWLFEQIVRYKLPDVDDILEYLKKEYSIYFEKIYKKALNENHFYEIDKDIHAYYASWELRGDDPKCYEAGKYEISRKSSLWGIYSVNKKVNNITRDMESAAMLYHAYHYNDIAYREGNKPISVEIPFHMIRGIQAVQKRMMDHIAKRGISIETNPTSNLMIGGLQGYEHHPILSFYNKGLFDCSGDTDTCAQIHVSINTDDLGVFATSLRNEYSLMAKSLEQMTDMEGNFYYKKDKIYEWLDNIRKMGNEQSFCYDD